MGHGDHAFVRVVSTGVGTGCKRSVWPSGAWELFIGDTILVRPVSDVTGCGIYHSSNASEFIKFVLFGIPEQCLKIILMRRGINIASFPNVCYYVECSRKGVLHEPVA